MKVFVDGASVTFPRGFKAQGGNAAIKSADKPDLAVLCMDKPGVAAGVFTTNVVHADCVDLNRLHLENGQAQVIVANSGNANACTGERGKRDNLLLAAETADLLKVKAEDVLIASTGVIGVPMPMDKILPALGHVTADLSEDGAHQAALAIMTTDLAIKEIAVEFMVSEVPVRIGAIAKGSGMIHPNMATMLVFITTDAVISHECLQQALRVSVADSYNMISVDRDTSTNDMALALSSGAAGNPIIDDPSSADFQAFSAALNYINTWVAQKIARDGEGATHLIEIQVVNAQSRAQARQIARSVSSSNLVKAAVYGQDANWGRIMAAAGYSGAEFTPQCMDVYMGEEKMAADGMGLAFDEEKAKAILAQDKVIIKLDLKSGTESATAWGCDLTYDYVKINASYRS